MSEEELEEYLNEIEPEDLELAIHLLEKRYNSWQNWLSLPSQ